MSNFKKANELLDSYIVNSKHLAENANFIDVVGINVAKKAIELASKPDWIDAEKHKPLAYEKGNWDGLRTDYLLVRTASGKITIARAYIGFLDGSDFCDWYLQDDFSLNEEVTHFMKLPENPFL